ncbi:MAG: hypothetical protein KatS3mg096_639 [Candidatus Parcubacteria bacterium]|nr:MAG: hypothetical protein KatS3mg096_639 [Candidatus Parcubacteria bacterium]
MKRLKDAIQITYGTIYFVIYIAASILQILLAPILVVYAWIKIAMIRDKKKRDDSFGLYNEKISILKDILGNVMGAYLFNDVLIKKDGYKFGRRYETISSVLGKNKRLGKLTFVGKVLCYILDKIDENHCEKSISYDNIIDKE